MSTDLYIFGYASLLEVADDWAGRDGARPVWGELRGWRRRWTVAMNNVDPVNDPKHWVRPGDGERADIVVSYLTIEPDERSSVGGIAVPVDPERLRTLDRREVNYEREDVTDSFSVDLGAKVHAYIATRDARERWERGREAGKLCVASAYHDRVRTLWARAGRLDRFLAETEDPGCRVEALEVVKADGMTGH